MVRVPCVQCGESLRAASGHGVLCAIVAGAVVYPVECADCGKVIRGARSDDPVETRRACVCGSTARHVRVSASDEAHAHERLDLKIKEGGRGRPVLELRQGEDRHRDSGQWNTIYRLIDRRRNRYEERVVGPDAVVVRDISVALDDHRGHGSDRSRAKAHP